MNFLRRGAAIVRMQSRPHHQHCTELVRRCDYEGYLVSLAAPSKTAHANALALRAFNVETAKVQDMTDKRELAQMRLVWWADTVRKVFAGERVEHPVAQNLAPLAHAGVTAGWFKRSVERRLRQLDVVQPATVDDVETYAEETMASLLYAQLESVGVKNATADHIASHIGKAVGLAVLIRAIPANLQRAGDLQVPQELLAKHDVSKEAVVRGKAPDALSECVFELATRAVDHLTHARQLQHDADAQLANFVFQSAVPTTVFLEQLEKANFNCFDGSLQKTPWQTYWKLWKGKKSNKF